jgi:hypothetical protein
MKEQLAAVLTRVAVLAELVADHAEFHNQQQEWNKTMSAEFQMVSSRLVSADAKAEAAHVAAKMAGSLAKKSAVMASKALQTTTNYQSQLKTLEANMAAIIKTQDTLAQQLGRHQMAPASETGSVPPGQETFENSIFLAGISAFRQRLGLHPQSDPVFVVSYLLKEIGIYSGMNSIVLADNAAKTRLEVRAVIMHMQSNFHKRAAMVVLRKELAAQRLPGTATRDCFPIGVMETVKRYVRFGKELKSAGKITKFQVVNRKGKPVLQTGDKNQGYADYKDEISAEVSVRYTFWPL